MNLILVNVKTKKRMSIGDMVKTFDNRDAKIIKIEQPNSEHQGRVVIEISGEQHRWFPSSIGAEFSESENHLKRAIGKARFGRMIHG